MASHGCSAPTAALVHTRVYTHVYALCPAGASGVTACIVMALCSYGTGRRQRRLWHRMRLAAASVRSSAAIARPCTQRSLSPSTRPPAPCASSHVRARPRATPALVHGASSRTSRRGALQCWPQTVLTQVVLATCRGMQLRGAGPKCQEELRARSNEEHANELCPARLVRCK